MILLPVKINGIKENYVVVGITQGIGNGGDYSNITAEAMQRHNSNFTMDTIYVYLNEGANAKDYIEYLNGIYGNQILTANSAEQIDGIIKNLFHNPSIADTNNRFGNILRQRVNDMPRFFKAKKDFTAKADCRVLNNV